MSQRKSRREQDKAIRHLMDYPAQQEEWATLYDEFFDQMFSPLAERFSAELDEVQQLILDGELGFMAFGYLFEEFATVTWVGIESERSLIDDYLKHRGWRESGAGRRYLQALNKAELKLWEVVDVKPGAWVEVRVAGSATKPVRVTEKSGSEQLHPWDCLAARVLRLDGQTMFSGGMLHFTPPQAAVIERTLNRVPDELRALLQEAVDAGDLDALPDDIDDEIAAEIHSQFPEVAFTVWASQLIQASDAPLPTLLNADEEPIEISRLHFPITGDREKIEAILDFVPLFVGNRDDGWAWYPRPADEIEEDETVSLQGHVWLKETTVELETLSRERANRGEKLLMALMCDHIGSPLKSYSDPGHERSDEDIAARFHELNARPEVQAAIQAQLTRHYRETLDTPVPMLNNKTPRECAANPGGRKDVINWLKTLENTDQRSPQPAYDFTWMWTELGIARDE